MTYTVMVEVEADSMEDAVKQVRRALRSRELLAVFGPQDPAKMDVLWPETKQSREL